MRIDVHGPVEDVVQLDFPGSRRLYIFNSPHAEFIHIGLAYDQSPGISQPFDDRGLERAGVV